MKNKNLLISLYADYEGYPPTINAVINIAKNFDRVYLIHRPSVEPTFPLPSNVKVIAAGSIKGVYEQQNQSLIKKVLDFFRFCYIILVTLRKASVKYFLIYDPLALLATNFSFSFHRKDTISWYHNHDILDIKTQRFMSIGWLAARFEKNIIKKISMFSLPAIERLEYYPKYNNLNFFFIPNYPSKELYRKYFSTRKTINNELRFIYQGMVGEKKGLELVIRNLYELNKSRLVKLIIKGQCSSTYKAKLEQLAKVEGVYDKLEFYSFTPYIDVPSLASTCHIGIAIQEGNDIMHKTLGTSSNKIYEYSALGLPVILFDNYHFREYLERFSWAFFTNGEDDSFLKIINRIIENYEKLSCAANSDFNNELNFEVAFKNAVNSFIAK